MVPRNNNSSITANFISLRRRVFSFISQNSIAFLFLFSGRARVVMFSYPVRRHSTRFTHETAFFFRLISSLDQSGPLTGYRVSLKDKESGRAPGVLMRLGRNNDLVSTQHTQEVSFPLKRVFACGILEQSGSHKTKRRSRRQLSTR